MRFQTWLSVFTRPALQGRAATTATLDCDRHCPGDRVDVGDPLGMNLLPDDDADVWCDADSRTLDLAAIVRRGMAGLPPGMTFQAAA
jgi:hypothetical protein